MRKYHLALLASLSRLGHDGGMADLLETAAEGRGQSLGTYLKTARAALGLSLRAVEERTGKAVTNGYLSQIESGAIAQPSPNVLWNLAEVYQLDYGDLLGRAGHRVPQGSDRAQRGIVAGFPMHALEELTEEERTELLNYIGYLRSKRPSERNR